MVKLAGRKPVASAKKAAARPAVRAKVAGSLALAAAEPDEDHFSKF